MINTAKTFVGDIFAFPLNVCLLFVFRCSQGVSKDFTWEDVSDLGYRGLVEATVASPRWTVVDYPTKG